MIKEPSGDLAMILIMFFWFATLFDVLVSPIKQDVWKLTLFMGNIFIKDAFLACGVLRK